ncbi:hypothetical protein [Mycobacterium sp. SP-6446]|uniref:hypothetical protein n=1 Tax=Mycobacterium sp. SP-6446 TaxID=1834162 RepID=UPI00352BCF10
MRPELAGLDEVLARALAKNPTDRFALCTEFADVLGLKVPSGRGDLTQAGITRPISLAGLSAQASSVDDSTGRRGKRRARRALLVAVSVLAVLALGVLVATFAAHTITASDPAHEAARDRQAAEMAGRRYLEALAVGDARTALSLSAAQPVNTTLLTDAALRRQLAATPITNIVVELEPGGDPAQSAARRLVLSANFGRRQSKTTMGLRKIDGQWKLDTTTITLAVGDSGSGNASLKSVAISGIPTDGISPMAVFPGTPVVSSSNKYVDIGAASQPLLLEALTDTGARPMIQPTVTINDAGRRASQAAIEARLRYCYNRGHVAPSECCPCITQTDLGQPLKLDTIEVIRFEDAVNMNYELDPNRMLVHVTGIMRFTFGGDDPSGPKQFLVNLTVNNLVDMSRDPPVYLRKS